jgi:hypothetical protein
MKFRFRPDDFIFAGVANIAIADRANVLLEEHEKTLQKVHSNHGPNASNWTIGRWPSDTHTALLWNPEEIGKGEK